MTRGPRQSVVTADAMTHERDDRTRSAKIAVPARRTAPKSER
jgi:hypothetical protein